MSNKEALRKAQENITSMRDDVGRMKRALTAHHKVLDYLLDRMEIVDPDPGFELTDLTNAVLTDLTLPPVAEESRKKGALK